MPWEWVQGYLLLDNQMARISQLQGPQKTKTLNVSQKPSSMKFPGNSLLDSAGTLEHGKQP